MAGLQSFPTSKTAQGITAGGDLLQLILGIKNMFDVNKRKKQLARPLGESLGFEQEQQIMTPAFRSPAPQTTLPPKLSVSNVLDPKTQPTGNFVGAPQQLQPILRQPTSNIASVAQALGPSTFNQILGSAGIRRPLAGESTPTSRLRVNAKGRISAKPGPITPQAGNVLLRQTLLTEDAPAKLALRRAMFNFKKRSDLTAQQLDSLKILDDTIKVFTNPEVILGLDPSVADSLLNKAVETANIIQRSVKPGQGIFEELQKQKDKLDAKQTGPRRDLTVKQLPKIGESDISTEEGRQLRFEQISNENPVLTDEQIMQQMAIEMLALPGTVK